LRRYPAETRIKILFAIAVASQGYSSYLAHVRPQAAFYLVQSRAWELLVGALFAIGAVPELHKRWQAELTGAVGLVLILCSLELISDNTDFPGLAALWPCAGAAAIIHSGVNVRTWIGRVLGSPPARFIGLISYSLYLWHWPIFVFYRFFREPTINKERVLLFAVCVVLATISWQFVEKPFRQRPYRLGPYGTIMVGGTTMIVATVLAVAVPPISVKFWNLPDRVLDILAYENRNASTQMRVGTCFLTSKLDDMLVYKKDICLAIKENQRNFLLVGDSHAAHLWSGFQTAYPEVNFLQATASGCYPVINSSGEQRCTQLIRFIYDEFLPNVHLDGIILSGRWIADDLPKIKATTEALRSYADKIFVFGPIVEYDQPLPRLLALAYGHDERSMAS
jgi:hypothetical protein